MWVNLRARAQATASGGTHAGTRASSHNSTAASTSAPANNPVASGLTVADAMMTAGDTMSIDNRATWVTGRAPRSTSNRHMIATARLNQTAPRARPAVCKLLHPNTLFTAFAAVPVRK